MRLVTFASLRGAPGVTTTALLVASALEDAVVVEADLDGGVLAARYGLGREPGLTTLAADSDHDVRNHAQDAGGVPVVVAPETPTTCASIWRTAGDRITRNLQAGTGTSIIDAGRLRAPSPIVAASDQLVVVVQPVAEQLVALAHTLAPTRAAIAGELVVLIAGDGPYRSEQIESELGVRVIGAVPNDHVAAEALRTGGSRVRLTRSRLVRAAAGVAETIAAESAAPLEEVAV